MPTSVVLNHKEGVWLIDSDKVEELGEKNVLTWMVSAIYGFRASRISNYYDSGNDARKVLDHPRGRV